MFMIYTIQDTAGAGYFYYDFSLLEIAVMMQETYQSDGEVSILKSAYP